MNRKQTVAKKESCVELSGTETGTALIEIPKLALTFAEVEHLTGISYGTLKKLTMLKKIPHVKIGRRVRFIPEELKAWLQRNGVANVSK